MTDSTSLLVILGRVGIQGEITLNMAKSSGTDTSPRIHRRRPLPPLRMPDREDTPDVEPEIGNSFASQYRDQPRSVPVRLVWMSSVPVSVAIERLASASEPTLNSAQDRSA